MQNDDPSEARFSPRHFGLFATILAVALLAVLGMSVWWAVQRVDSLVMTDESRAIAAGLVQERDRLVVEQTGLTTRDDAVLNLRTGNRAWIADNLAGRTGESSSDDRVYVEAANGAVMRVTGPGEIPVDQIDPEDKAVVEPLLVAMRRKMAAASAGLDDSTQSIAEIGMVDLVRLPGNRLAFVSMQPVVGTSQAASQRPGTEFLHVWIRGLEGKLLSNLSGRIGLSALAVAGPGSDHASLALQNAEGRPMGYLSWTPNRPALKLLRDTAPTLLGLLCLGFAGMVGLLVWLRRAALQLEASRDQTSFLAFHDPLTGLANRVLFQTHLEEAMGYEYLAATRVLLVSIDLDHFKEINDTLGHAIGDQLLEQVGKRLSQGLSEDATLARLAGDEFAIVQPGIVSDGHAQWLCEHIMQSLTQPFALSGGSVPVTASFGVALEAGDAVSPQEMLRRADVALYAAKAAGSNCLQIYTPEMDRARRDRRALEVELRQALISGTGLFLLYQPVFDAASGEIAGAEALVRWLHPTWGNLAPDAFVAIAEETGIIDALGLWVLDEACRFAVASGLPRVAVNVSPLQFLDSQFPDQVLQVLHRRGLDASRLELEITEGLLLKNSDLVHKALVQLRKAGLRIALDDFGTGYSSISYLRTYNVDKLKIDQSFTRHMTHNQAAHTIIRSVIEMAHALGMSVTAEGVEDEPQQVMLRELGCDYLQGYLLSRPITGELFSELLTKRRPATPMTGRGRTA